MSRIPDVNITGAVPKVDEPSQSLPWYVRFPKIHPRICATGISIFIAARFLSNTRKGVRAYFSPDDIMNLYGAFQVPVGRLILENIFPFTTGYRPLGAAFYRIAFALFGMNPIPFRIGVYIVMMVNIALLYRVAKRLSGSVEIGVLSALLYSFHPELADLYLNGGTVYDVLSACFYFAALDYYLSVRERQLSLRGRQWVVFCILTITALNAKETAATLPAMLLVYELVFHGFTQSVPRWLILEGSAVWVSGIISVAAIMARMREGSPLIHNQNYALHFSARQFFSSNGHFLQTLFLLEDMPGAVPVLVLFLLVFGIAFASRSKCLQFCAFFLLLTPLPVDFITPRGLYAIYIAVGGWAIYLSALCVYVRNRVCANLWQRPARITLEPERVMLFLLTTVILSAAYQTASPIPWSEYGRAHSDLYRFHVELLRLQPNVVPGSKTLLLNDPFPSGVWTAEMMYALTYKDLSLQMDRAKKMTNRPDPSSLAQYEYVFDYQGGRLVRMKPAN